jgi:hypothetical protein
MFILRIFAVIAWILALLTLGIDLLHLFQEGTFEPKALGLWWSELHVTSLTAAQNLIERHIYAPLWNPGIVTVLLWPAWAVFGALAFILTALSRMRGRRRIFGRR